MSCTCSRPVGVYMSACISELVLLRREMSPLFLGYQGAQPVVVLCVPEGAEEREATPQSLVSLPDNTHRCRIVVTHGRHEPPHLLSVRGDLEQNALRAQGDQSVAVGKTLAATDVGAVEAVASAKRRAVAPCELRGGGGALQTTVVAHLVLVNRTPLAVGCAAIVEDEDVALAWDTAEEESAMLGEENLVFGGAAAMHAWVAKAEQEVSGGAFSLLGRDSVVDDGNLAEDVEREDDVVSLGVIDHAVAVEPVLFPCLPRLVPKCRKH
mmetsp:Transcript_56812/g.123494  ORF Transcript_56812/g.123494 Transcript_56812/m.123494 type:complete len:267 (-) Transcript_56812:557-1357(-)